MSEKTENPFLKKPEKLSEEEIEEIPREMEATFFTKGLERVVDHAYNMKYKDGKISFTVKYRERLPNQLSEREKNMFSQEEDWNGDCFVYKTGELPRYKRKMIGFNPEYHVSEPLVSEGDPEKVGLEEVVEEVGDSELVFYTGAGISKESDVFSQNEFREEMSINNSLNVDGFIQDALNQPEELMEKYRGFCRKSFGNSPTPAHMALKKITLKTGSCLLTENYDLLHERSGVRAIHTEDMDMEEIQSEWLDDIDYFFCIGLSRDDRGLLSLFKKRNPEGRIISMDIEKPSYLGRDDFFLKGDLQKNLPELWSLFRDS